MANKQYPDRSKSSHNMLNNQKVRSFSAITTKAGDDSESGTDSDEARRRIERIRSKLVKKKKDTEKKDTKRDSEEEEADTDQKLEQERREERKRKMNEIQRDIKCIKRDLQHRKRRAMMQDGDEDSKKKSDLNEVKEQYGGESAMKK